MTKDEKCYNIVITMVQKIVSIGNSEGIILPAAIRKQMGIKKGSRINIELIPGKDAVILQKADKEKIIGHSKGIDKEFKKWLKQVLEEDAEILDELAVR